MVTSDAAGRQAVRRRHSTRHDQILEVLQDQTGHISADELFEAVRGRFPGSAARRCIGTLERMVDDGVARRVDFGEGGFATKRRTAGLVISIWCAAPAIGRPSS